MKNIISIIVILASILLAFFLWKGTDLFIYPFLSDVYYLHLYALVLLSFAFVSIVFQNKIKANYPPPQLVIFLAWNLYIALYSIFNKQCEIYYCTYLLTGSIISLLFVYFLKYRQLNVLLIYIPIALLGASESIVAFLQYVHVVASKSPDFAITGSLINPNVTAMIICLSIPAWIEITRKLKRNYRYTTIIVWLFMVAALYLLQCRTAVIGAFTITGLYLFVMYKNKHEGKYRYLNMISVALLVLLTGMFFIFQQHKQSSADGRITIWKISAEMINKKPLTGTGYGIFQKEYNLQQADYFNRELRPEAECMNAGYTVMAYDEYLEQTVMGGLPGGLLFTAMILSLLWAGWKSKEQNFASFAGVAAFAVMSVFNFTIDSPMLFLAFMLYASVLIRQYELKTLVMKVVFPKKVALACVIIGMVFVAFSLQKYNAQLKLTVARHLLQQGQTKPAGEILDKIKQDISTSEAYYRTKESYYLRINDFEKASTATIQALKFTSTPNLILDEAQLSEKLGNISEAENYYELAGGIEPHLYRPRIMQMAMYLRTGQKKKAVSVATEILQLKPKFNSDKVSEYKQMARKVIDNS